MSSSQRVRTREPQRRQGEIVFEMPEQVVSHATLSAFRVGHRAALEGLMTDMLGTLLHKGLVELAFVAQDGTRVRANASPRLTVREPGKIVVG